MTEPQKKIQVRNTAFTRTQGIANRTGHIVKDSEDGNDPLLTVALEEVGQTLVRKSQIELVTA